MREEEDWNLALTILCRPFLFYFISCFFFFFNVYSFLRDRDRAQVGEGQRERETQNLKQAPGSELSAQNLTWGSNS